MWIDLTVLGRARNGLAARSQVGPGKVGLVKYGLEFSVQLTAMG